VVTSAEIVIRNYRLGYSSTWLCCNIVYLRFNRFSLLAVYLSNPYEP
jgi:hypothetical protein